jgi:hypothetical protein
MRNVYKRLVEKSEGDRPLGRPRRTWERNIKMDCKKWGGGCLVEGGSSSENFNDPPGFIRGN